MEWDMGELRRRPVLIGGTLTQRICFKEQQMLTPIARWLLSLYVYMTGKKPPV